MQIKIDDVKEIISQEKQKLGLADTALLQCILKSLSDNQRKGGGVGAGNKVESSWEKYEMMSGKLTLHWINDRENEGRRHRETHVTGLSMTLEGEQINREEKHKRHKQWEKPRLQGFVWHWALKPLQSSQDLPKAVPIQCVFQCLCVCVVVVVDSHAHWAIQA